MIHDSFFPGNKSNSKLTEVSNLGLRFLLIETSSLVFRRNCLCETYTMYCRPDTDVLHMGNKGDCAHAPRSLPWCLEILQWKFTISLIGCPHQGENALVPLVALSKTK